MGAVRHECQVRPEELGPFLLGQLAPTESDRVADAVAACASCTAEVAGLRPVVAALETATATPRGPDRPEPPEQQAWRGPDGLEVLLSAVHRERGKRLRAWRLGAVAAGVALLLGLGTVIALQDDDTGGREVRLVGAGPARGTALVTEREWGTAIDLTVSGLQPGQSYGAWLEDGSGERVPAGTFRATSGGAVRLELSALMPVQDAAAVGVTRLGGSDVLRYDF